MTVYIGIVCLFRANISYFIRLLNKSDPIQQQTNEPLILNHSFVKGGCFLMYGNFIDANATFLY